MISLVKGQRVGGNGADSGKSIIERIGEFGRGGVAADEDELSSDKAKSGKIQCRAGDLREAGTCNYVQISSSSHHTRIVNPCGGGWRLVHHGLIQHKRGSGTARYCLFSVVARIGKAAENNDLPSRKDAQARGGADRLRGRDYPSQRNSSSIDRRGGVLLAHIGKKEALGEAHEITLGQILPPACGCVQVGDCALLALPGRVDRIPRNLLHGSTHFGKSVRLARIPDWCGRQDLDAFFFRNSQFGAIAVYGVSHSGLLF